MCIMKKSILSTKYIALLAIVTCFFATCFLSVYIVTMEQCECPICLKPARQDDITSNSNSSHIHQLAVLVPFRDRFEELLIFIPHMNHFLSKQNIKHSFFIINQVDELRFNRASLINVGFKLIRRKYDYFAIHDVDLLPLRDELKYNYPADGVFHVSSPGLHPKYHYPTFLGGILLIKREDFEKVNGMSNRYWGWGLEDDEFYTRLKDAAIAIVRPEGIPTGPNNTFLHIHKSERRRRDMRKCFNQMAVTRKRDRVTGLHNVKYHVNSSVPLKIDNVDLTVVNIGLICDHVLTPWCQCDNQNSR